MCPPWGNADAGSAGRVDGTGVGWGVTAGAMVLGAYQISYPEWRKRYGLTGTDKFAGAGGGGTR